MSWPTEELKEFHLSSHEFTVQLEQTQIDVTEFSPVSHVPFGRGVSADLNAPRRTFSVKGALASDLPMPSMPYGGGDYDVEVTVKLTPKFYPGHYRLKSSGAHATALYWSKPPWKQERGHCGIHARRDPDAWERVRVTPVSK